MSILSRTLLALCSMALFSTPLVATAHAAAIAAADQGNGYAGQVLEKVVKNWQPPQAAGDYTVRVRARIDGDGKALSCVPEKSSNLALMDKSACAAVMSAGKFGNPPYGLPMDVFLTFWTGLPRVAGTSAGSVPSADTTNTVAQQKADAATAAAVALAKAAEARAASATAKPGQGAHSASPAASPTPASPAPATSTVKTDTAGGRVVAPPSADALALRDPKNREPLVGPAGEIANPEESRYAKKVASTIRQHMVIPAELPRGLYTFKMLVHLSPTGEITQANITQSSGEAPMDKYALRATKRAQKVAPPPSKKLQDLHLTFVVQRP